MNDDATTDALLERVRHVCFDFAGTEEKLSHGSPFFNVRGKGYLIFAGRRYGDGSVTVWCKSTADAQQRLVAREPDLYFVPPYMGVKGWVGVRLDRPRSDFDALAILVEEAWSTVVPKKLVGTEPKKPAKNVVYPKTDPDVVKDAFTRLSKLCDALPETVVEGGSQISTFRVGKRPYAYFYDNVHRDGMVSVCFRVAPEEMKELIADAPKRYYPVPYMGPRGWVAMRVDVGKVSWKEVARRVTASYESVAPAKRKS
jgi:hypothetical protein